MKKKVDLATSHLVIEENDFQYGSYFRLLFSQYMLPIGTIIPYAGDLSKIPYGWHVCDGTNGTPDLSERFLEGTTTTPKTFKDAGLPNISGSLFPSFEASSRLTGRESGCFTSHLIPNDGASNEIPGEPYFRGSMQYDFSANRSNSIYGSSDTVQPKSYTVYYIMRIK